MPCSSSEWQSCLGSSSEWHSCGALTCCKSRRCFTPFVLCMVERPPRSSQRLLCCLLACRRGAGGRGRGGAGHSGVHREPPVVDHRRGARNALFAGGSSVRSLRRRKETAPAGLPAACGPCGNCRLARPCLYLLLPTVLLPKVPKPRSYISVSSYIFSLVIYISTSS